MLVWTGAGIPAAAETAESLPPGVAIERPLATGGSHLYRPELTAGQRFSVRVEQLGVDVEVSATPSDSPKTDALSVDSPIDRDGLETLLLPPAESGWRIEIRGREQESGSSDGRYRIRLERLEDSSTESRIRLRAEAAMTRAGQGYSAGDADGRRQAVAGYREAAGLWRDLGEAQLEAQALYSIAVLYRLLGEGPQALERAREVLPLWRRLGDAGREADTLNEIGLLLGDGGQTAEARDAFARARVVQETAGDRFRQMATTCNLCLTFLMDGELVRGRDCYRSTLEQYRGAGNSDAEASAHTNLGRVSVSLGEPEVALEHYRSALALHRAAGREKRWAETLNQQALLHKQLWEPEIARELYLQALEVFRRVGDGRWEARTLHNLGAVYHGLGEPDRALGFYQQALEIRRRLEDPAGQANTLKLSGHAQLELGRAQEARELYEQSLRLEQTTGDRRGEAISWRYLGQALDGLGQSEEALTMLERADSLIADVGDRPAKAQVQLAKGRVLLGQGQLSRATAALRRALDLFRTLGVRRGEADTLYYLAEAELESGHRDGAFALVEEALELLQGLRSAVGDPDLLASFSGVMRRAEELHIELLMARSKEAAEDSVRRLVRAALEASERSRARGLLELLHQAGVNLEQDVEPGLRQRLRAARQHLYTATRKRQRQLARDADSPAATEATADLFAALAELEAAETQARRQSPGFDALARPEPLRVSEIQQLLDADTVLLQYALGWRRSFLWWVSRDEISGFELPSREVIETAVLKLNRNLSSPFDGDAGGREVADLLLGPVADRLKDPRLVIVPDGVLHYLPFAALSLPGIPDPAGASKAPLIVDFEIIHLPSASALALQRRRLEGRPRAPHGLAILADPVFDRQDPRFPEVGVVADDIEMSRGPASDPPPLLRLPGTRREAEAIATLLPNTEPLLALGFDASRSLVESDRLGQYRIVHLATHGLIDTSHPALSALVLSGYLPDGRPQDGYLRLRDIYGLELAADLVVLSACRTALGRSVRGEGMIGLTRGFLHSGAKRVLASLWSVPDRATAELMHRFYHALLIEDRPAPAALRQAQLSMLAQRRWRDPHNWAGFVIQGDWVR